MTTLKQHWKTESEIVRNCVEYLRLSGWFAKVFAQDKSTRRQSAGWVDIIAFKHGVTLLIECKSQVGRRRGAQQHFFDELQPHIGPCLWYVLARDVGALERVTALIEECLR